MIYGLPITDPDNGNKITTLQAIEPSCLRSIIVQRCDVCSVDVIAEFPTNKKNINNFIHICAIVSCFGVASRVYILRCVVKIEITRQLHFNIK